jgi:hypothetical protein
MPVQIEAETQPPAAQDPASASIHRDVPLPQSDPPETRDVPLAKTEKSAELRTSGAVEHSSAAGSSLARENPDRQDSSRKAVEQQRKDLAKQISKAIEIRAIRGVHVSVIDGIAYLDGKVATSEQRNAAERAARGVSEVREIHNRIAIE